MKKSRRIRIDRLIIVILSAILLIGLLGLGIYELIGLFNKNKNENIINEVQQTETVDNVKIEQLSYEVYKDDTDTFDFNFVLATVKFIANEPISFNLNDLQTSEKISLGNVSEYMNKLIQASYSLDKLNISNTINEKDNECTLNIFIPYKKASDSDYLQVYNVNDPTSNLVFDKSQNVKYFTSLKFIDDGQNINVKDTNIYVSSCSVSTMMVHNGEEYNIGSTNKVFTFKINVNDVKDDTKIVDAYFIREDDDENIPCMSSEYESVKVKNILNKTLVKGENGALFFEMYAPELEPNYDGVLMLKFSNSTDWVKITTSLE